MYYGKNLIGSGIVCAIKNVIKIQPVKNTYGAGLYIEIMCCVRQWHMWMWCYRLDLYINWWRACHFHMILESSIEEAFEWKRSLLVCCCSSSESFQHHVTTRSKLWAFACFASLALPKAVLLCFFCLLVSLYSTSV